MSEMVSHWSFGHLQPKLWAKEGPGVKLAVWLPTTKSRESTRSRRALRECNTAFEISWRGLQVWFKLRPDQRSGWEAMMSQSPESPKPGQFRDSTLGVSGKSVIRMQLWWRGTDNTIRRMVVAPPESGPWCVMWVRVSPWLVLTPNACRMSSNQLVLVLDAGSWPNSLISSWSNPGASNTTPLPLLVLEAGSGTKFLTISANPTVWTFLGHTRNLGARQ
jgi:hypothetical protein